MNKIYFYLCGDECFNGCVLKTQDHKLGISTCFISKLPDGKIKQKYSKEFRKSIY